MIKIMNDRMKNDLTEDRKEREQNEEALIDVLENTCNRLQQILLIFNNMNYFIILILFYFIWIK